jgi:hypothetical protein
MTLTARVAALIDRAAARFRRPLRMPQPGETLTWWTLFTLDNHDYQLIVSLEVEPAGRDGMPWALELTRDRQPYDRKLCPDSSAALDLQAAWKRMVREHGLGRVYWVGSARVGRFDLLIVDRDEEWRLLVFIKDRLAERRTFATEADAIDAAHALELDFRTRPWLTLETTALALPRD